MLAAEISVLACCPTGIYSGMRKTHCKFPENMRYFHKLLAPFSVVILFAGCLNQDFERASLARYRATRASTFVGFDPLRDQAQAAENAPPPVARRTAARPGMTFPAGGFTGPGRGRFTGPAGNRFSYPAGARFSYPAGNRFSYPAGNRFSYPAGGAGRMSMPMQPGNRFSWPSSNPRSGFTQPTAGGRSTYPAYPAGSGRGYTNPSGR